MTPPTFPAATATDRFQILAHLGEGGMGVVYEALDREQNVRVALKRVRARTPALLSRFKREFRVVQDLRLRHPGLVSLRELFEDDAGPFFTMDLIEGVDLIGWVRPGSLRARSLHDAPTLVDDDPRRSGRVMGAPWP